MLVASGERREARITLLDDFPQTGRSARVRFDLAAPAGHPLCPRSDTPEGPRLLIVATASGADIVSPASRTYSVGGGTTDGAVFHFTPDTSGERPLRFTVYDRTFGTALQEVEASVPVGFGRQRIATALRLSLRRLGDLELTVNELRRLTQSQLTARLRESPRGLAADEVACYDRALAQLCDPVTGFVRHEIDRRLANVADVPVPVRRLVDFHGGHQALSQRELRGIATEIVRRAVGGAPTSLPPEEQEAVADALALSLAALGELETSDVEAVRVGSAAFARQLKSLSPGAGQELSQQGAAVYDALLEISALHILHFFNRRSTFEARLVAEQSQQFTELSHRLDQLLARTPGRTPADAAFEEVFTRDTTAQYHHLTIHGVDLPRSPDSWPLPGAYTELRCEPDTAEALRSPAPVFVREALAGLTRVLVRGDAGSGKTTLTQWLAVSTLNDELPASLAHLRSRIPFVVPVRRLPPDDLPLPSDLLRAIGHPSAGAQPAGWAERVLGQGRGLLLIDGVDEVPEAERARLRRSLRDLTRLFPDNVWLLTTRPTAVPDRWLQGEGFSELRLTSMSGDDVAGFVRRWHHAARADNPADADSLDRYEESLLRTIERSRDLHQLAASPLLCGLLCAIHRERRGYLPSRRTELYEAAVSMLLDRRDRERTDVRAETIDLPLQPKLRLLQGLAYWMVVNDRLSMNRHEAVDVLGRHLPAIPAAGAQGDAERIYQHLLNRTGLLCEPTPETVEFVHEVFRHHLAASELVRRHDFDLLLAHGQDAEWADVFLMAVSQARPDKQAQLLEGLIGPQPIRRAGGHRRRHVLAAACLDQVSAIDPGLRHQVLQATRHTVHPTNPSSARGLGWAGPLALDLLPDPANVPDDEAYLLAVTATSVSDNRAIGYLKLLRTRSHLETRTRLAEAWHKFDTTRYAKEIIAHLDETDLYFPVRTLDELRALDMLGGRSRIRIDGVFFPDQLVSHLPAERLTHLWITRDPGPDLEWLSAFPQLLTVRVPAHLHQVYGAPAGIEIV